MTPHRQPNESDLLDLAKALSEFGVEYVVIGGSAMALHGFPRMTKDIDLLLPVDPANNARLLKALESMQSTKGVVDSLRQEWMDKGHSTELVGEISIDLLYVAASQSFEAMRGHVQTLMIEGIPVVTLDVDGMLATKQTTRDEDKPDRMKLGQLRNLLQEQTLRRERMEALPRLKDSAGAAHIFWQIASAALIEARGNEEAVDWAAVEEEAIAKSIGEHGQAEEAVQDALCNHSPGAVNKTRQYAIRQRVKELSAALRRGPS